MTFQPGANLYTQGFGSRPENVEVPHIENRVPATTDILYPVGKRWIFPASNIEYTLTSLTVSNGVTSANWTELGTGSSGVLDTLSGDSGTATPSAGNIAILGNSNQITTTASGATVTLALAGPYTPATYTAHGVLLGEGASSIVATTPGTNGQLLIGSTGADPAFSTLTSSGGTITVTGGAHTLNIDIVAPITVPNGGTGATTLTAHGVLLGEGTSAVVATAVGATNSVLQGSTGADPAFTTTPTVATLNTTGALTVGNALTVTAGGAAITGTTNINTTGAAVTSIGTGGTGATNIGNATGNTAVTGSLTASTTLTATLGAITATNGNLHLATAGNKVLIATGANASIGIATLTAGTVTVATTAVTASSQIFVSYNTLTSAVACTLSAPAASISAGVHFVINSQDTTDSTSTVNWWIVN
jgi:hypothetical protein